MEEEWEEESRAEGERYWNGRGKSVGGRGIGVAVGARVNFTKGLNAITMGLTEDVTMAGGASAGLLGASDA